MFCDMCLFNRFTNWHGNYMIWNDSSYSSSYFRCVILNEFSSYSSYSSSYILVFCFYVKIIFFRSAHGKKHAQHHVWIVFCLERRRHRFPETLHPPVTCMGPTSARVRGRTLWLDSPMFRAKSIATPWGRCRWHRWPWKNDFFREKISEMWFVKSIFNG